MVEASTVFVITVGAVAFGLLSNLASYWVGFGHGRGALLSSKRSVYTKRRAVGHAISRKAG